ncbi:MAG: menaquinone biosynthesis protein [Verrucomicrobiota bacterium]
MKALDGLRIGCVRYLNSRPLIEPYAGPVVLDHPSALAAALARGDLDVALVPVYEALRSPGFAIADGVSISSLGPVWSVFIAHQGPVSAIRSVSLDPASLTSVNLFKVLFAEWGDSVPNYVAEPSPSGPEGARLIIGNQAIAFREQHGGDFNYFDLGEEWLRRTGLPFVFAVWLIRPEVKEPHRVAAAFREIATRGRKSISKIAANHPEYRSEFAIRYLTQNIRFDLGGKEKQGIALFRALLCKHGFLPAETAPPRFL